MAQSEQKAFRISVAEVHYQDYIVVAADEEQATEMIVNEDEGVVAIGKSRLSEHIVNGDYTWNVKELKE